jgi:plasmid stabilization system protein ParE
MNIIWSPEAIGDLVSLRAYIAEDDPAAARGVVLHIIHNVEQLLPTIRRWGAPVASLARAS